MSKEALKLALEALKMIDEAMPFPVAKLAQAAIKETLAQPEQEPDNLTIAYMAGFSRGKDLAPQRTWVGLTWNDVPDEWVGKVAFMEGAKWADKQLKEKNA